MVRFLSVKSKTFSIFWPLILCLGLLSSSALCAEVDENALWSLQFKSVSISEALKKITQTTGIKIITPKQLGNQVITRSYENQTIEHILKDMFRDMNYALVWSYGEKGIDSVRILALDKGGGTGAKASPGAVRPGVRDYPAARYPAQRQYPQKGEPSRPRRSMMEREPEDTEPEAPSEQKQEEDDQGESESKEEEKESIDSSEESDEEKPIPPKRLPPRSNEGVEKGEQESQSEGRQSEDEESVPSSRAGAESTEEK